MAKADRIALALSDGHMRAFLGCFEGSAMEPQELTTQIIAIATTGRLGPADTLGQYLRDIARDIYAAQRI